MDTAVGVALGLGLVCAVAAVVWYGMKFELWAAEKGLRLFERLWLRSLTRSRVRPDYWDMAILSRLYIWLSYAGMTGGVLQYLAGRDWGIGVMLAAFAVWGIASRCNDHAHKPRKIDNEYLLMWWECGRLNPPPYVVFG